MLFIGDRGHIQLSENLAKQLKVKVDYPEIHTFPDGEKRVRLSGKVSGEKVILFKSFVPNVDAAIIETCLLIDAALNSGAKEVILVAPYLPYQRAEKAFQEGEGVPLAVFAKIIESSGVDRIITVDPHIENLQEYFSVQVDCISAEGFFITQINTLEKQYGNLSIVSPDKGGEEKVIHLQKSFVKSDAVVLSKKRNHQTGKVEILSHTGKITDTCVIVDDMITSGNTIREAARYCTNMGAKNIIVIATHLVMPQNVSRLLKTSNIKKIYASDSCPINQHKQNSHQITQIGLTHLIAQFI